MLLLVFRYVLEALLMNWDHVSALRCIMGKRTQKHKALNYNVSRIIYSDLYFCSNTQPISESVTQLNELSGDEQAHSDPEAVCACKQQVPRRPWAMPGSFSKQCEYVRGGSSSWLCCEQEEKHLSDGMSAENPDVGFRRSGLLEF